MVSLSEYLENPCGTLSVPYWKAKSIIVPKDMRIVHENAFSSDLLDKYDDTVYFRLLHDFSDISFSESPNFLIRTADIKDIDEMVAIINASYYDLHVDSEQLKAYTKTIVYDQRLWVFAVDKDSDKRIGCGIADFDAQAKELSLEWIQVLPTWRRKGAGKAIVNGLLMRRPESARFATVSGKVNNSTCPEKLYRKCGFNGHDYWHILKQKGAE